MLFSGTHRVRWQGLFDERDSSMLREIGEDEFKTTVKLSFDDSSDVYAIHLRCYCVVHLYVEAQDFVKLVQRWYCRQIGLLHHRCFNKVVEHFRNDFTISDWMHTVQPHADAAEEAIPRFWPFARQWRSCHGSSAGYPACARIDNQDHWQHETQQLEKWIISAHKIWLQVTQCMLHSIGFSQLHRRMEKW